MKRFIKSAFPALVISAGLLFAPAAMAQEAETFDPTSEVDTMITNVQSVAQAAVGFALLVMTGRIGFKTVNRLTAKN